MGIDINNDAGKAKQETLEHRKKTILKFIENDEYIPVRPNELAKHIGVPKEEMDLFDCVIDEMLLSGDIVLSSKKKIMPPENMLLFKGTFIGNIKGFGFVVPVKKDQGDDIYIPASNVNGAMHKDVVLCRVVSRSRGGNRREGEIVRVISREYNEIVGVYSKVKKGGVVVPGDRLLGSEINIPAGCTGGAVDGSLVSIKITRAAEKNKRADGRVVNVLGHVNDPGIDITAILYQRGIPVRFGEKVYTEVKKIPDQVSEADLTDRQDFRDRLMITIDGEDSKDLDDAVSLEVLPGGHYLLGVYIADVAHYVDEGSELDKEAYKRGTSVYLADRVVPMLPHKLSNGICSLNPNEDRLSLACIMEIDGMGVVVSHEIHQCVINVNHRMTYKLVSELLSPNGENGEKAEEYTEIMDMLKNMERLSGTLRQKRINRGALEFDFPEAKIIADETGRAVDVVVTERNVATSIIEEFMLVCNETIAEEYFYLQLPFVYRCHEEPDGEKIRWLACFAKNLGYSMKGKGDHSGSIQKLLAKIESTPEESIISRVALRSLKQARYMPENLGHFGLAARFYCHFTSPIRRYPDLQIHRIIKAHLNGRGENYFDRLREKLPDVCSHSSETERSAESVEREVEDMKKVEYMSDKIGEVFEGIISGVTSWGLYVELPNTVEGMIPVAALEDDWYYFDKENLFLIGQRKKRIFRLGDKLKVEVVRADVQERKLDFILAEI